MLRVLAVVVACAVAVTAQSWWGPAAGDSLETPPVLCVTERDYLEKPQCRNELAAVYQAKNQSGAPGCSYMHYNGANRGAYQFPNCKSQICADVGAGDGKPAVTYNKATRLSYYTTGTGKYVWVINTVSGLEQKFANLPFPHSFIIGLEIIGTQLWLFTVKEAYFAPLTPIPATFALYPDFAALGMNLQPSSLVDVNPATPDFVYLTGRGFLPSSQVFFTFRFTPPSFSTVNIQGITTPPRQMFWSTSLSTAVFTNSTDALLALNLSNGMPTAIVQTPMGSVAATINGDYYYSANTTFAQAQNIKNGKSLWCAPINGVPILGNFVYLA